MGITVRTKKPDRVLKQITKAIEPYSRNHPTAQIEIYRYNSVSVRIRVVDPAFRGMRLVEREEALWSALDTLPEEIESEVTLVLLYTPEEAETSFASVEFDDPLPSRI